MTNSIAVHGAPVHVNGFTAGLTYSNHNSVVLYSADIINDVHGDVRVGRAFVFLLRLVNDILELRLSPMPLVAATSITRIRHDRTSPRVNAETGFSTAATCQLGLMLL